jgi:hypothetical protein
MVKSKDSESEALRALAGWRAREAARENEIAAANARAAELEAQWKAEADSVREFARERDAANARVTGLEHTLEVERRTRDEYAAQRDAANAECDSLREHAGRVREMLIAECKVSSEHYARLAAATELLDRVGADWNRPDRWAKDVADFRRANAPVAPTHVTRGDRDCRGPHAVAPTRTDGITEPTGTAGGNWPPKPTRTECPNPGAHVGFSFTTEPLASTQICFDCEGTGFDSDEKPPHDCTACNGTGRQ